MKMLKNRVVLLLSLFIIVSCGDPIVPKPMGYFRIDLPEHEYQLYNKVGEPYSFEYPSYCTIEPDNDANAEPHWINIHCAKFNCKIHVTYRPMHNNVDEVLEDSRKLTYKHTVKADAIGESYYDNDERKVYASLYRIKGNAATPLQFSITDSVNNMFRGSLYFYCRPNADSLAPVISFVEEDVVHLIESFGWN